MPSAASPQPTERARQIVQTLLQMDKQFGKGDCSSVPGAHSKSA